MHDHDDCFRLVVVELVKLGSILGTTDHLVVLHTAVHSLIDDVVTAEELALIHFLHADKFHFKIPSLFWNQLSNSRSACATPLS